MVWRGSRHLGSVHDVFSRDAVGGVCLRVGAGPLVPASLAKEGAWWAHGLGGSGHLALGLLLRGTFAGSGGMATAGF